MPEWNVWNIDGETEEEDACTFEAHDSEDAAEKWAENYDIDEYTIVGGESQVVMVRRVGSDTTERLVVSGETVAAYYVHAATRYVIRRRWHCPACHGQGEVKVKLEGEPEEDGDHKLELDTMATQQHRKYYSECKKEVQMLWARGSWE